MARQVAQPLFCRAAFPLENAGASRRAIAAFSVRQPGRALRGSSDLWTAAVSQGQPLVAAGRSPGAARVRALRGTPAGATSGPTHMTPHESALRRTEH